jgi:hypothetical protein
MLRITSHLAHHLAAQVDHLRARQVMSCDKTTGDENGSDSNGFIQRRNDP